MGFKIILPNVVLKRCLIIFEYVYNIIVDQCIKQKYPYGILTEIIPIFQIHKLFYNNLKC